ncbi:type II toxin-antitoxin system HicA family toxin [Candidatus Daviesbacteria bacterium]|nr:type II toxin-antitoxin system HicA family toxin [Candidatus Daviesbacteria bacterium]
MYKPLSYRDLIKKVRKAGFIFRRNTGGTHEIWWNEISKKTCVIPHHHEIKSGTLRNIIKQMGVNQTDFEKL